MQKYPYGVVYLGHWNELANGEGVLIDKDGTTIVDGLFVDYWIKYKSKK